MSYIHIKNLSVIFNRNKLFNNISLNIEKGTFTIISTPSAKGKTTFLNLINGNINSENIFINDKLIDDDIKSKISLITNNSYNFYSKTVIEELLLTTNNINQIKKYLKDFDLLNILNENPLNLDFITLKKLDFIKALLNKSEIILFDNIFCYFDKYEKIEFIGYIKKYQYEKNKTFICTTNTLDDAIFCDKFIMIDKEILFDGNLDEIYLDENILNKSKINLPLEHELIDKLKLYNLIDNVTYDLEEVVEEICK